MVVKAVPRNRSAWLPVGAKTVIGAGELPATSPQTEVAPTSLVLPPPNNDRKVTRTRSVIVTRIAGWPTHPEGRMPEGGGLYPGAGHAAPLLTHAATSAADGNVIFTSLDAVFAVNPAPL
jgi:hypothetical protein